MLRSFVCRQCTLRLSRRAAHIRNPSWQQRATFISLRSQNTQDDAEPPKAEPDPQSLSDTSQTQTPNNSNTQGSSQGFRRLAIPSSRYAQYVPEDADIGSLVPEAYSADVAVEADSEAVQSFAQPIDEALKRRLTGRAWRLFEETYTSRDCEALTNPPFADLDFLQSGKLFQDLMMTITIDFCNAKPNLLVTPTEVLFKYEQLGIARPEYWGRYTIGFLTRRVILAVNAPNEKPQLNLPSLLSELLSLWRLFFQCNSGQVKSLTEISDDWHLPAMESLPEVFPSKSMIHRLNMYHPKTPGDLAIGFCACYLYTISDALNSVEALAQQAAPFLEFMERLLAGSLVGSSLRFFEQVKAFRELPPEVREQIQGEIKDAPRKALASLAEKGVIVSVETKEANETQDTKISQEEFYLKRMARAVESRASVTTLETHWAEIEKEYVEVKESKVPIRIYNAFLSGFMVLRESQHSVRIWNHMIASGIGPDMQTWVALMDGCVTSRDLDGFNGVWKRLLSTGMEPDIYVWTCRVNGLIRMRQINLGLIALDEMGKKWLSVEAAKAQQEEVKKKKKTTKNLPKGSVIVNHCTKPSVELVNGAISALVQTPKSALNQKTRTEFVQKILGWARHFQIKPDIFTYNILIRMYLDAGENTTAFKVLKQMEKEGIPGDIATYTLLLTAMFDHNRLNGLSKEEQVKRVLSLFGVIEASGVKLTDRLYATAIDKLLKQYSNHDAVKTLVTHMTERKLVPNAYLYTSLITYYLQLQPPDIRAVESLIMQVLGNHRLPVDRIMLDRVLEGFATHNETDKMTAVLKRMEEQKRYPSWRTLKHIVTALVRHGDIERARELFRNASNGIGVSSGGKGSFALDRHQFFVAVRALGAQLEDQPRTPRTVVQERRNEDTAHTPNVFDRYRDEQEMQHMAPAEDKVQETNVEDEDNIHGFLENEPEPARKQSQRA